MKNDNLFAHRLKLARELAGLTQSQVAKMLELHRPSISEIEAGRRNVTADELIKLSEIYSVDINWILKGNRNNDNKEEIKIDLAARELSKLKDDDLDKIMDLLIALRKS